MVVNMGESGSDMDSGGGHLESVILVNGLVCSILRAKSRFSDPKELVNVIETKVQKEEIKTAWHQLFSIFKEVEDPTLKKPVIEIARSSYKLMIEDILKLLSETDRRGPDVQFALPWDFKIHEFQAEIERRACRYLGGS